jgi:hypothetical protein
MKVSQIANASIDGFSGNVANSGAILAAANAARYRGYLAEAIEPNPEVFCRFSASIAVNGFSSRASARNVALAGSDEPGKRAFFVPTDEPKNGRFVGLQEDSEHFADRGVVSEVALGRVKCTEMADHGGGE